LKDHIKKNEMGGACGTWKCVVYRVSAKKPDEKRPHGKPRRRLEDNIKMDLQAVRWKVMDSNRNMWQAVVNAVTNIGVS
jgi:hypothetical protein